MATLLLGIKAALLLGLDGVLKLSYLSSPTLFWLMVTGLAALLSVTGI